MADLIADVLAFWFGPDPEPSPATMRRWFTRDPGFDAEIRERFGALHDKAAAGGLAEWLVKRPDRRVTARNALALIIVLDQFSRNLYRDDARAFAQDVRAHTIAREVVVSGLLGELTPIERMFALLPYEHAEDRASQREAVAAFEHMVSELMTKSGSTGMMGMALDYARRHAEIIERFGRFPHRNAVLGRESTPEELAFLAEPGSRF